jgi:hypothetical protein
MSDALETIRLNQICVDGGTQSRAALSQVVIAEYAEVMQSGTGMPPVVVFHQRGKYWLADGFHRYYAAKQIKMPYIECDVRQGGLRDAILYAAGANVEHGLRRTNDDKHHAIMLLLRDKEWVTKSNHWIATACAVNPRSVGRVREQYAEFQEPRTVGLDGKTRKAGRDWTRAGRKPERLSFQNSVRAVASSEEVPRSNYRRATAKDFAETLAETIVTHPEAARVFELLRLELVNRGVLKAEKCA